MSYYSNVDIERIAFGYLKRHIDEIIAGCEHGSPELWKSRRAELRAMLDLFCATKGRLPSTDYKELTQRMFDK